MWSTLYIAEGRFYLRDEMHYVTREITWEALYLETRVFDSTASPENSQGVLWLQRDPAVSDVPYCRDIVGFASGKTRKKRQKYREVGPDVAQTGKIKKRGRRTKPHGAEFESGRGCCWIGEISSALRTGRAARRERCVRSKNRSCFRRFFLSRVRYIYHTYTHCTHSEDENDVREGERGNLARVWHTGLPVKTCEGRHQMLFRTRLSRSAAHTQCLGKIETGERIMGTRTGMVLPADRAPRHGRLARSCAPRENWKALGHGVRRNFKWPPKTGAPPTNRSAAVFSFSPAKRARSPACGFDLQRGNVVLSRSANRGILFAQSISSAR